MPEQHQTPPEVTPVPQAYVAPQPSWKQNAGIPVAIVVAAALIAGAIYLDGSRGPKAPVNVQGGIDGAQNAQVTAEIEVAPVTEKDHIRGNPNAPIMIVEYSDYDCPFCKNFHETMNRIIEEYGASGKVAWVYRHFPLEQLHPNAPRISAAAYCVAEQGGTDAFWKFSDLVFEGREINAATDMKKLPDFAAQSGVDKSKFELCFNSGKYAEQVKADVDAALKTGARGTPHSIVLVGDQQGAINGAQPYETVKQIVENLISQVDGNTVQ
jgi:protein-disulfide isomerase